MLVLGPIDPSETTLQSTLHVHLEVGVGVGVVIRQVTHVIIVKKGHCERQGVKLRILTSSWAEMISVEELKTQRCCNSFLSLKERRCKVKRGEQIRAEQSVVTCKQYEANDVKSLQISTFVPNTLWVLPVIGDLRA